MEEFGQKSTTMLRSSVQKIENNASFTLTNVTKNIIDAATGDEKSKNDEKTEEKANKTQPSHPPAFALPRSIGPSSQERWLISGEKVDIIKSGIKAVSTQKGYGTALGRHIVRNDEHCEWTISINKGNRSTKSVPWCYIGIVSKLDDDKKNDDDDSDDDDSDDDEDDDDDSYSDGGNKNDVNERSKHYLNSTILYNNEMNIGYYSGSNDDPGIYGNFNKKTGWKAFVRFEKTNMFKLTNNCKLKLILDTKKNEIIFIKEITKNQTKKFIDQGQTTMSFKTVCKLPSLGNDNNNDDNNNNTNTNRNDGWQLYCNLYHSGDNVTIESCNHRYHSILDLNLIANATNDCLYAINKYTNYDEKKNSQEEEEEGTVDNVADDNNISINRKDNSEGLAKLYEKLDLSMLYVIKDNIDEYISNYKQCMMLMNKYDDKLRDINSIIEKKVLPNVLNYKEWDSVAVVTFILSLNQQFSMYKNSLLINFNKQNFNGKCLDKLEKNDLIEFGINDFSHRSQIYQALKNVVNGTFKTSQIPEQNKKLNDNKNSVECGAK